MKAFLYIFILLAVSNSYADLDPYSQEALDKTKRVMKDSYLRREALKTKPEYQRGEQAADDLVGGNAAQKDQLYDMAAEVLETLAKKANGDAAVMQRIVLEAQKNPEKFMKEYMSSQQGQIRDLANQIEKDRTPKAPAPK